MPLNYLLIGAINGTQDLGDELTVEYPTGSGEFLSLDQIASDLRRRLIGLFTVDADGRRPCFGGVDRFQNDPRWFGNVGFNEYFHGDNGAGLGALARPAGRASSPISSTAAPVTACTRPATFLVCCEIGPHR